MSGTKEQLLGVQRKLVTVAVEGVDGPVRLQSPTAGAYLEYQKWLAGLEADSLEHLLRVVALTAVDDEGKPLLTEQDCRELPHHVVVALSRAAFSLISTTDKTVSAAKGKS